MQCNGMVSVVLEYGFNHLAWVYDTVTSPCIDDGNPGSTLGEESNQSNNIHINMGAYGGAAQASIPPYNGNPSYRSNPFTLERFIKLPNKTTPQ